MSNPDILIWEFSNAPKEYQKLSTHGGDEDYIIVMKKDDFEHEYNLYRVVDRLTVCDYKVVEIMIDNQEYCVIITAHG